MFLLQNISSELDAVELQAWQDLRRVLAHEMMNSLTPISSLAESVRPLLGAAVAADPNGKLRDVADAVDVIARADELHGALSDDGELPPPVLQLIPGAGFIRRIDQLMRPILEARGAVFTLSIPQKPATT